MSIPNEYHQRIISAMDGITAWVEQSKDLVSEQAPAVAQEIVTLGIIGGICGIITLVLTIALPLLYIKYRASIKDETQEFTDPFMIIFGSCIVIGGLIGSIVLIVNGITALVAPRLYILEDVVRILQ